MFGFIGEMALLFLVTTFTVTACLSGVLAGFAIVEKSMPVISSTFKAVSNWVTVKTVMGYITVRGWVNSLASTINSGYQATTRTIGKVIPFRKSEATNNVGEGNLAFNH